MSRWRSSQLALAFLFVSEMVFALELLESLDAEGQSVVLDKSSMAKHQPGAIVDQSLLIPKGLGCNKAKKMSKELAEGLSYSDFERMLKRDYCATSLFYKTISRQARQQVYDAYLLDPDLTTLRKMILSKMQ